MPSLDELLHAAVGGVGGTERPGHLRPSLLVLTTGEARRDDVMGIRTPDGEVRWLLVNSLPVRDDDGVMTGVVSSFSDITEKRALAQAREERKLRWRAAQGLTGLAWWELDLVTGAHHWSDEMFHLVGLQPSDAPPDDDAFLALDAQFHLSLAEASGNAVIAAMTAGLRDAVESYVITAARTLPDWPRTRDRLRSEHRALVAAIAAADPDRARALVEAHISGYYAETHLTPTGAEKD